MENNVFINNAFDVSFKTYIENKDNYESLAYNGFLCGVIRMLVLIYGEDEILNFYNSKDENGFNTLMLKYGYSVEEYSNFINNFGKCYNFHMKQDKKAIKKKNRYFNLVQKSLIDMLVAKKNYEIIETEVINEFYDLLFTANSKNFYRKSIALVQAFNPYEIDDYFKRQNLLVG